MAEPTEPSGLTGTAVVRGGEINFDRMLVVMQQCASLAPAGPRASR